MIHRRLYLINQEDSKYKPEEKEFFYNLRQDYQLTSFDQEVREVFDSPTTKVGQTVILTGAIARVGTLWIAKNYREELAKLFSNEFIDKVYKFDLQKVPSPNRMKELGVTAMVPVSEGGIFTGLWEISAPFRLGMEIDWSKTLINQVTIEFCEALEVNPYQLYAGGCSLMVTDNSYEVICELEALGIPCQIIGRVTKEPKKVIHHGEICRAIMRPEPDELLRLRELKEVDNR
ncbi:hypothetical protein P261_01359 [Lachnospiraceae bacterium TWA4]|nr:hypothetical protein P261_01359 [Lachnospiraceae bacterium TWA4]